MKIMAELLTLREAGLGAWPSVRSAGCPPAEFDFVGCDGERA
jgi:hypothetical protein